jgi:hypothetical protein
MSFERARQIMDHAEPELADGYNDGDVFNVFAAGGASERLEALWAIFLTVADLHRLVGKGVVEPSGRKMGELAQYTQSARHFVGRLVRDPMPSDEVMLQTWTASQATFDAFVHFVYGLDPQAADYEALVYDWVSRNTPRLQRLLAEGVRSRDS